MKKLLILLLLAAPCQAEITSKLSSSTSLTVGASSTQATRVPSTYAVSGTNMKVTTGEHFGKLTAGSATAPATLDVGVYEINTAGSAFSFQESWHISNYTTSYVHTTSYCCYSVPLLPTFRQ